jgi:hypothetical protein
MTNLHIVTVATESKYYFPYLVKSCKRNGKNIKVLGYGEKWEGYNFKYKKITEYLKTLPNNDIVCFVDGYDVICTKNLNNMPIVFEEIKNRTGSKIIVGYDNKKNIYSKILTYFIFGMCNNTLLNSGTYIGNVVDILLMLEKINNISSDMNADDQLLLTKYCNLNPNDVYIDVHNELFLTLIRSGDMIDYISIENNKVTYNNKQPFFIHAAGGASHLDSVIPKLGYKLNVNIKDELSKDYYKKCFYYLRMNSYYFVYFILALVIIILLLKLMKTKVTIRKKKYL